MRAAAQIAAETMKRQHDRSGLKPPDFQQGDLVWLDGKNLALQYEKTKLAPKRFGPFRIEKSIGPGSYRIKLPETWKIHPVFHSTLLLPYKETIEHGDNYTRPPPDIINDHPEHEVEAIINVKKDRRYKKEDEQLRYTVKWKGYPDSENTEEPLSNMLNAPGLLEQYHRNHPNKPKPSQLIINLSKMFIKAPPALMVRLANAVDLYNKDKGGKTKN